MRGGFAEIFLLLSAIGATGAGAMTMRSLPEATCKVVGGEKLPVSSGGGAAMCAEIERAVARAAPTAHYDIEVRVLPKSRLIASLTVSGRALPEQHFAMMDGELDTGAVQRFAATVAEAIAQAAKAAK
jgi:hypothetical protein